MTTITDSYAIPFKEVLRLLNHFTYASKYRVAIQMMALTGCRPSEIEKMGLINLRGNVISWRRGKNQKGWRRRALPAPFIKELFCMLKNTPHTAHKLFDFNIGTLRRIVNTQRLKIGGGWTIKREYQREGAVRQEYIYQLKGLRHNYVTMLFYNYYTKYDAALAVEFAAKEMGHSSYKMTSRHYLDGLEILNPESFVGLSMAEILNSPFQSKIGEFIQGSG